MRCAQAAEPSVTANGTGHAVTVPSTLTLLHVLDLQTRTYQRLARLQGNCLLVPEAAGTLPDGTAFVAVSGERFAKPASAVA